MAGLLHTPAPDGPYNCVPTAFFFVGLGSSVMVYVFQICLPVAASYAATLPRNLQHSYVAAAPAVSSADATGTYRRPLWKTTEPTTRASGWPSALIRQSSAPVMALSA